METIVILKSSSQKDQMEKNHGKTSLLSHDNLCAELITQWHSLTSGFDGGRSMSAAKHTSNAISNKEEIPCT